MPPVGIGAHLSELSKKVGPPQASAGTGTGSRAPTTVIEPGLRGLHNPGGACGHRRQGALDGQKGVNAKIVFPKLSVECSRLQIAGEFAEIAAKYSHA